MTLIFTTAVYMLDEFQTDFKKSYICTHRCYRKAANHFVETSFLEIELLFGGNHLLAGCSTVFLLPYQGATPFSSPPSVDGYWHGLHGDVLPDGGVPKF
jgi:hypothetical protein